MWKLPVSHLKCHVLALYICNGQKLFVMLVKSVCCFAMSL